MHHPPELHLSMVFTCSPHPHVIFLEDAEPAAAAAAPEGWGSPTTSAPASSWVDMARESTPAPTPASADEKGREKEKKGKEKERKEPERRAADAAGDRGGEEDGGWRQATRKRGTFACR